MSDSADKAMQAYRLGATAMTLVLEKPKGWRRKLGANFLEARRLGVKIEPGAFNDVIDGKIKLRA